MLLNVFFSVSDEDLAGDHLLAETTLSLKKLLSQAQKKFQLPLERPNLKVYRTPLFSQYVKLMSHMAKIRGLYMTRS